MRCRLRPAPLLIETGHPLLDAGVAQHAGVAELDEYRTLGMLGVVTGDPDVAHFAWGTFAGAHVQFRW